METLLPWIISMVSGGAGGAGAGALLKEKGLGMVGNLITGALGGAAGNAGLAGTVASMIPALAGGGSQALGGGIGGLVLTAIVGLIKSKMK